MIAYDNQTYMIRYHCDELWAVMDLDQHPLTIDTLSTSIVDSMLSDYSLITFYTAIVIVIASGLRGLLYNQTYTEHIKEISDPKPLLQLCEYIHMMRAAGKIDEENKYYLLLVHIMRRPDIINEQTGSSIKGFKLEELLI